MSASASLRHPATKPHLRRMRPIESFLLFPARSRMAETSIFLEFRSKNPRNAHSLTLIRRAGVGSHQKFHTLGSAAHTRAPLDTPARLRNLRKSSTRAGQFPYLRANAAFSSAKAQTAQNGRKWEH